MSSVQRRLHTAGAVIEASNAIVTRIADHHDPIRPRRSRGRSQSRRVVGAGPRRRLRSGLEDVAAEQERQRSAAIEAAACRLIEASNEALADRTAIVNDAVTDEITSRSTSCAPSSATSCASRRIRPARLSNRRYASPPMERPHRHGVAGAEIDVTQLLSFTHGAPISILKTRRLTRRLRGRGGRLPHRQPARKCLASWCGSSSATRSPLGCGW